jgi:hypothetical protein
MEGRIMTHIVYEVVQHDGGWAYRVGDVYSETYATHKEATAAAKHAAAGHALAGKDENIEYEDRRGVWHDEFADGDDRPETEVEDGPGGS